MHRLFVVVLLFTAVCARFATAQSKSEVLEDVLSRHRAAVETIQTFYCKHTVKYEYIDGRVTVSSPLEYWRAGDAIRAKWQQDAHNWSDTVVKDMRDVTLSRSGENRSPAGNIIPDTGNVGGISNPWSNALFQFMNIDTPATKPVRPVPFSDLVADNKTKRAERVRDGQDEAVVVELEKGRLVREFWFDPRRNYLIKKLVAKSDQGEATWEVVGFKEAAPGVYFPEAMVIKAYKAGALQSTRTATFADIRVNMTIPESTFRLDFPPNIEVHDLIQGKKFITDASGRPSGAGVDLPHPPPPTSPGHPVVPRTVTKSEPTHWTAWVLPASAGILAVGGGAWGVRRWRTRGERAEAA
jgi:hypothetical protein